MRGVDIGKWTENIGAVTCWLLGAVLVLLAVLVGAKRGSATPIHVLPTWNWNTVNFWSNIAYGLSGVEMAAIWRWRREIRDPERTLPRAGWIASGFATVFYSVATVAPCWCCCGRRKSASSMAWRGSRRNRQPGAGRGLDLALDWRAGGGERSGAIRRHRHDGLAPALCRAASTTCCRAPSGRVPIPAGGTPARLLILTFGAVASFLLLIFQLGDSLRAAYQEMISLMVITGFLPYLYVFASAWKAGKRISAISGVAITLLAIMCSVVPTEAIANVWLFEGKLAAGTLAVVASAWLVYRPAGKAAPSRL